MAQASASDHFYYMCTKWFADGDVHAYFSPYGVPDAFINFMNAYGDFRRFYPENSMRRQDVEAKPALVHSNSASELRIEQTVQ